MSKNIFDEKERNIKSKEAIWSFVIALNLENILKSKNVQIFNTPSHITFHSIHNCLKLLITSIVSESMQSKY